MSTAQGQNENLYKQQNATWSVRMVSQNGRSEIFIVLRCSSVSGASPHAPCSDRSIGTDRQRVCDRQGI